MRNMSGAAGVKKGQNMEKIRKHFIFYGNVQGVGFRYRASYAAKSLGITGWVRNEWDGTVEMEAQGGREEIRKMLLLLQRAAYLSIDRTEEKELPVRESESGFHIR